MPPDVDDPTDVTALFLVRLRFEAGSVRPMRAEVRMTDDVVTGFEGPSNVTDAESIFVLLENWLQLAQARVSPHTE